MGSMEKYWNVAYFESIDKDIPPLEYYNELLYKNTIMSDYQGQIDPVKLNINKIANTGLSYFTLDSWALLLQLIQRRKDVAQKYMELPESYDLTRDTAITIIENINKQISDLLILDLNKFHQE